MTSLTHKLSILVGTAFEAEGLPAELGLVCVSDRPDLAQFQCNGAMSAAKLAKKAPRQVAEAVLAHLEGQKEFSKIEIAGPGFINLNVTDEFLAHHLANNAAQEGLGIDTSAGNGQTIILDYGGYTIAKPLHVGHLRSTIIGDSIKRLYQLAGYEVFGDVHLADWGTQMGMIISELENRYPEWPYFDISFKGEYPSEPPITLSQYAEIYPTASKACKEDNARMELARKATFDLQEGRSGYRALWRHMISVSIKGIKKHISDLNVDFELWKSEGDVHDLILPMIEKLKSAGFSIESEGALVIPVEREDDKKEMPPLILLKSDGAVLYGTTDLATIVERIQKYAPAKIIYVVDQRQSLHFEQVFRAAYKTGIAPKSTELTHAGFGTMNGPDGKPFKTRAGGVMKLEDLITNALKKAQERLNEAELAQDMSDEERADIAHKVGIAAIKFADLQNNRSADYIFDIDRMTSFEGKTGPYLLYQTVRIKSLLKKANDKGFKPGSAFVLEDSDRTLALLLNELPDHFTAALKHYTPHILCDYAFKLAQSFSSFYAQCHILSEKNEALRASRLALCELTCKQLELVLDLLGIKTPKRM